jgi:hypothetical protein
MWWIFNSNNVRLIRFHHHNTIIRVNKGNRLRPPLPPGCRSKAQYITKTIRLYLNTHSAFIKGTFFVIKVLIQSVLFAEHNPEFILSLCIVIYCIEETDWKVKTYINEVLMPLALTLKNKEKRRKIFKLDVRKKNLSTPKQ